MDRSSSSVSSMSNFSTAASTAASVRSNTRSVLSSPSVSTRHPKSVLSDKYMLGEELGRGAYGQVYKGLDTRTGDTVAIKQMSLSGISQENLQSVMGEIELLKNLNHKNIVKYLGSFKTRTHLYIILEFMENGSLASIIKPTKFGAFPESLVAVYIAQVLQGLAYLHDQGVVHRDIKGANILTTKEGLVKLADFGVAAKLGELEEANNSLRLSVVGTPYWMAPEVIEMTSVTAAADIWSVACLSIELLTGQAPYYDLQPMSALFRIVQDEHPPLPEDISPGMHNMLLQCFNKDPQKRPDARTLLRHPWIQHNRQTLRSSWSRTQGLKARGARTDAHVSVNSVVERMLAAEAEDAALAGEPLPSLESATSPHLPAPARQKQGTPVIRKTPSFRDSAMETASVDTAYQPSSSQHGHSQYAPSASPASTSRRPSRHSDSGPPAQIRIDIPPTPTVPPSAASSYDSTYYTSQAPLEAPLEASESPADATALPGQPGKLQPSTMPQSVAGSQQPTTPNPTSAVQPRQQTDARAQSPLGGLMGRLGSQSPDMAATLHTEDLLAWLETKDRQVAPPLHLGTAQAFRQPSATISEEPVFKHQEAAEVRRLVGSMRMASSRQAAAGSVSARETPVVEACQVLTSLVAEDADRKPVFLAEGGVIALMELLEERSTKVVLAGLELANALVASDASVMETMCLVGIVPTIARFAAASWARGIRLQAALFVQQLCRTSLATAQMFVACQGLPVLVGLIEDNVAESGKLTEIGVDCIWRVLEVHGMSPLNHLCRLLANAGLPHRLMRAMLAFNQEYQLLLTHAEAAQDSNVRGGKHARSASHPGDMQQALLGMDTDDYPRSASHAYASTRTGGFSPTADFVGRAPSTRGGRPPQAPRNAYRTAPLGSSRPASPDWGPQALDVVSGLLQKMGNLLLVLSHADTAVKGHLCRQDNLLCQFELMQAVEPGLLLKLLKSLKHLTLDPSTLPALQDAGTIQVLPVYLQRGYSTDVQLEALHAMYNMCKISPTRQEAAALAGVVPLLVKLAISTPSESAAAPSTASQPPAQMSGSNAATSTVEEVATVSGRGPYPLRPLAVSLLCGMAHSTHRTRHELWAHNVVALLLDLLKEEVWQGPALDALAAWLGEDPGRIEPRLRQQDAVQRFVALFASYSQNADSEALARLLDPFLRIMKRSRKITVEVSLNGMAPLLVQLLKQPNALTALNLLQIVRCMYEQHPRPKEFIVKFSIAEQLRRLAAASSQAVLVRKQAQNLLDAFQLNVVF
ncbi:TPA: hypothetical protein ACH3X2_001627 [Trebouxia sp. C0005]|nr:MAG: serine threonine- kinase sepA-like [Trebouxia sp. A1-2]